MEVPAHEHATRAKKPWSSTLPDRPPAAQKIAEAEQQIARYELELARLKRARNKLPPVGHLPMELLLRIISLAWVERAFHEPDWLVKITHMCSDWRRLALGAPALWAHVGLENPRYVRAALERSRGLPLTVVGALDRERPLAVEACRAALGSSAASAHWIFAQST
ncbi:hypothetical protein GLOTRDRAFT_112642 [Gloeophyllum trabeum ATCC 11539]|uniref:Uncharacterized protein n=1 Tax=Gloeophyllum trabeum (strain ATCC 11539 / FP-39264 / Madison 617) TaxID=670483 RepID=S7PSW8_GLOTA|nr:uncharacterized protein GLOTRDRAFT_112642 [Gloeophyllum trabeum ATCC 11539]EPQ50906.1 hypothetical protein GLOTRDRAFT_112642 [Gloeophyllum trabeum ATCC 11539]